MEAMFQQFSQSNSCAPLNMAVMQLQLIKSYAKSKALGCQNYHGSKTKRTCAMLYFSSGVDDQAVMWMIRQ